MSSTALAKQDSYPVGAVRASTDQELSLVSAFISRHPEYARLSHLELVTLAATYRDDETLAERVALIEGGVPPDWHRPDYDEDELFI